MSLFNDYYPRVEDNLSFYGIIYRTRAFWCSCAIAVSNSYPQLEDNFLKVGGIISLELEFLDKCNINSYQYLNNNQIVIYNDYDSPSSLLTDEFFQ